MSIYAGFFKRFFAFIVDFTLVVMVTWLLYLFPANVIINKSIDSDYKHNIKNPYDDINEKYSGTVSYFGSTTSGEFEILKENLTNKYIKEDDLNSYRSKQNNFYSATKDVINSLDTIMSTKFNIESSEDEKAYSKIYQIYTYLDYSYSIKKTYPKEKIEDKYISFSSKVESGDILKSALEDLENTYKENLKNEYINLLEILIRYLKAYNELYPESETLSSLAYTTIASKYNSLSSNNISDLTAEYTEQDKETLVNYIKEYHSYQDYITSKDTLKEKVNDDSGETVINFNDEAYYNFYYTLSGLMFNEQLPYYVQVYEHTLYTVIYALSMFTVLFSVYTMILRGNTVGRRMVKIRLTDGHEGEKLNPVYALLHDVLFRFLYIIALGLFSLAIAMILMLGFTIADAIMIRFTKSHKTIRDILSKTRVVDGLRY